MTRKKSFFGVLRETAVQFFNYPAFQLSAATAFYSIFSIGPLLVLVVGLAGLFFGETHVQNEVGRQLQSFVGERSTRIIQSMMAAQMKGGSLLATIVGAVALIFGSTAVFAQVQESLNTFWDVAAKPGHSFWTFMRDRSLSLAMVLCVGFLLLVSMALSTFVNAFAHYISGAISLPAWAIPAFNGLASFLVIWLLFALIFKVLPDVIVAWRDVWVGAAGTALLFTGGKYLLGLYLSHETNASAYGAGSAFVVILLYVNYASLILFFGAEFTRVYAKNRGARVIPKNYALRVKRSFPAAAKASSSKTRKHSNRKGRSKRATHSKGNRRAPHHASHAGSRNARHRSSYSHNGSGHNR